MARVRIEDWLTPDNLTRLKAWARDGLTNAEIAALIGISERTFYNWQKQNLQILQALKKDRELADIKVENALYKRAVGFTYTETMIEDSKDGRKVRKTTKFVPPDTGAAFIWLKNRRPDKWRDKPVDESESATLAAAKALLADIPSAIGGGS